MRVKLLKDIYEGGQIKITPGRAERRGIQMQPKEKGVIPAVMVPVEIITRTGRKPFVWTEGTVLEMSDATAARYIERGDAEAAPAEAEAREAQAA